MPQDEFDPTNERTIKLAVAVARATGNQHVRDPIVFLQGGPGASIVEDTALLAQTAFAHDLESRDLVVIDQRGTGLSQPNAGCPEVQDFGRATAPIALSDDAYQTGLFGAWATCLDPPARKPGRRSLDVHKRSECR